MHAWRVIRGRGKRVGPGVDTTAEEHEIPVPHELAKATRGHPACRPLSSRRHLPSTNRLHAAILVQTRRSGAARRPGRVLPPRRISRAAERQGELAADTGETLTA